MHIPPPAIELSTLNEMPDSEFVAALADIFERSPWVAEAVVEKRPFQSLRSMHMAMVSAVDDAGKRAQAELVRAHPDLAGKAAVRGELTDESQREQASAGLDALSEEEFERFQRLNDSYRARFGFPFIIAVREHSKAGILSEFERRLENSDEEEFRQALCEIAKIARYRLDDRLKHTD